jgi:signal transduction histidine kinase
MTWAAQMNQSHYALMRLSGNISAYAGGDLSLRPSRLDLDFWLRTQLRVWESLTQAAGRTLDYRGTSEPCYCTIDPDAMERALLNLLSNAIKFSPAGSTITLSLRQKRDRVTLTLRDQGCGIPADQTSWRPTAGG